MSGINVDCKYCDNPAELHNGFSVSHYLVPADDLVYHLAEQFSKVIFENAPTWQTDFKSGPGDVVSVRDAALVVAKFLAESHVKSEES